MKKSGMSVGSGRASIRAGSAVTCQRAATHKYVCTLGAKLTKSKVQVEGGHGRSKGVCRRFPGLPKRQRVLGSISSSSGVARPQQWRQEVRARGIETEPCRR